MDVLLHVKLLNVITHPWPNPNMKRSSNGNIFRVTGRLCGEFTGHW